MKTTNDITKKDDALRLVMQRRKERRPVVELPEGFEDRVMERISGSETKSTNKAKVARLWLFRAIGAAAVVSGIIFLVEVKAPEAPPSAPERLRVGELRSGMGATIDRLSDLPKTEVSEVPPTISEGKALPSYVSSVASSLRSSAVPKGTANAGKPNNKTIVAPSGAERGASAASICIDCELDAMSDELTAMINEFENQ